MEFHCCRLLTQLAIGKSTFFPFAFELLLFFFFFNCQRTESASVAVSGAHVEVVRDEAKPTLHKRIVGSLNIAFPVA